MEKAIIFFVSLFILSVLGGIFINPKGIESISREKAPVFEFEKYTFFFIDENGVREYLKSSEGYRYDDSDIIKEINYYKKTDDGVNIIKSDIAFVREDYIDFNGSVNFVRENGYEIDTEDVRYNKKDNKITGFKKFFVTFKNGEFSGEGFVLDVDKKNLKAERVKAVYYYN